MSDDTNQSTPKLPAEQFTLTVRKGEQGLWYVTGSMHRGLLVFGRTLSEALGRVEDAWGELQQAERGFARAK